MDDWYSIAGFTDPMSSISHLAGTVVFSVLSVFLLRSAWPSRNRFWFSLVFVVSVVLLLTMSFVYHMMAIGSTSRTVLRCLDIAAIFILIAGTFTVFHGILFSGWKRWGIMIPMWIIAVTGIVLRSVFYESVSDIMGIGIFLLMGWIGAFSAYLVWKDYGFESFLPLLIGGILYSVGALIDGLDWPVLVDRVWGPHETFHLFVLAALGVHWSFVAKVAEGHVVPKQTDQFQHTQPPTPGQRILN